MTAACLVFKPLGVHFLWTPCCHSGCKARMQVTSVLTFTTLVDLWRLQPRYILQTKNANIVLCTASAISPISSPKVTWLKFKSSPRGALKREKKAAFIGMSVYTYMHSPPTHARTHTNTHTQCTHTQENQSQMFEVITAINDASAGYHLF